jgi:hypothetical protein
MKTTLDINTLSELERDLYLKDSWCPKCQLPDLGITNAELYLESGHKFISGSCKVCGCPCITEIIEKLVR